MTCNRFITETRRYYTCTCLHSSVFYVFLHKLCIYRQVPWFGRWSCVIFMCLFLLLLLKFNDRDKQWAIIMYPDLWATFTVYTLYTHSFCVSFDVSFNDRSTCPLTKMKQGFFSFHWVTDSGLSNVSIKYFFLID